MTRINSPPVIGVVGVCASGKTTLVQQLKNLGVDCHHIAQEHSYVPDMWKRITNPDFLIYLDVSYKKTLIRKNLNWTLQEYQEQQFRLRDARINADLIINTDQKTPQEIIFLVINTLHKAGL